MIPGSSCRSQCSETRADGSRVDPDFRIFLLPLDGGEPRDITGTGSAGDGRPSYSPDGRWLAYTSDREGVYEVYVDSLIGKTFRGWYGFDAGPVLLTWFLYRDAVPLPAQENSRARPVL